MTNRRNLILGAALGAVAPKLVLADSLVAIPGDPLTKHGLHAASVWASEEFRERPGARLVFASGHKHRWMTWPLKRQHEGRVDHAVAIEVAVMDAEGRRFVHTTPIDAVGMEAAASQQRADALRRHREDYGW